MGTSCVDNHAPFSKFSIYFFFLPLTRPPLTPVQLDAFCTRFVTLSTCDYVVAARYRDYDQHSTRASKVVQDILATKEKWQTVRLHCAFLLT